MAGAEQDAGRGGHAHEEPRREAGGIAETAPGPIIRGGVGGNTPYVVNPRTRRAAPIIDETTGQPMTDAQRLGSGSAGSASAGREKDIVGEIKRLDDEYAEANPDASKAERDSAHFRNREVAEKGIASATTKDARSASGMSMRKYLTENPKATAADLQQFIANQTGMSTAQRVIAQRGTSLEIASNVAEETIPLLRETSHRISRTEFPTLNSVLLAVEKGTGNTDVVRFSEQLNSFQYLYARALNPNGIPRIEDMKRLEGIIAQAWTEGQIDAALDQITIGLGAEKKGVEKTRESHGGAPTTGAPAPAAGPSGGGVVIQNGMRFNEKTGEYLGQANK